MSGTPLRRSKRIQTRRNNVARHQVNSEDNNLAFLDQQYPTSTILSTKHRMMATNWDSLPNDVHDRIFNKLEFKDLFRCKTVSKVWKNHIESDDFYRCRGASCPQEGSFTAINYNIKHNTSQCFAYDLHSNSWRLLPPFLNILIPDAHPNFHMYSITGHRSLICAEVSKLPNEAVLVVFNPMTGKKRILPPLLYPRKPVLIHILINSATKSYTVVVAGSSSASEVHLPKKVEVFRSTTSKWTEASDIPRPLIKFNKHQRGVCVNGVLHVIARLDGNGNNGVIAFDVENGKWLEDMACVIPFSHNSYRLQLVECDEKVHLYTLTMRQGLFVHSIDVLECANVNGRASAWHWRNVVRVRNHNPRGWRLCANEKLCVSFGDGKLCLFNMMGGDGVVYNMQDGSQVLVLAAPPRNEKGEQLFTLIREPFSLQPCFDIDSTASVVEIIENKDVKSIAQY
ncbi:hypothetical protein KC19_10G101100 [Ceratodon purpureus]|uniref:F-box domain-containing protein n=1 Tax=Ceratodon purpureus TaxID=3225 RepID=A0A8T0GLG0_CERPU|nr:hypothetical protein KC19_10G101100 [Ceratodon purpureus]